MNKLSKFTSKIYGALLIIGGIIGYIKAGSKPSLITGVISGILIYIACKLGKRKPKDGYLYIAALSLSLATFFAIRYASNLKFMPSGLMLIVSAITLSIVSVSFLSHAVRKKKK